MEHGGPERRRERAVEDFETSGMTVEVDTYQIWDALQVHDRSLDWLCVPEGFHIVFGDSVTENHPFIVTR